MTESGIAKVKQEYLVPDHKRELVQEFVTPEVKKEINKQSQTGSKGEHEDDDDSGSPSKKIKLTGRNKKRHLQPKPDNANKLCHAFVQGGCKFGDTCKFSHDVESFMKSKPKDIGESCYVFETFGKCPYSFACRYGNKHIGTDYSNVVNEELYEKTRKVTYVYNVMDRKVQESLRRKKYDFSKAGRILRQVEKNCDGRGDQNSKITLIIADGDGKSTNKTSRVTENATESKQPNSDPGDSKSGEPDKGTSPLSTDCNKATADVSQNTTESANSIECSKVISQTEHQSDLEDSKANYVQTASTANVTAKSVKIYDVNKTGGCITDEDVIKLRPQEKKKINFADKLYLAPLTTVGNLPFRRICKSLGADITCGEMALVTNILQGKQSEWALLKRHESEDLFGVQICGGWPDTLIRGAQLINETLNVDFVDLNCGCPIDLIFNRGEGCGLMRRSNKLCKVVMGMSTILDVPFTVKMRTGIYADKSTAHELIPRLRDAGASLVTLHGRSREQRYTRLADWDYINECAMLGAPMPVFGNGDILSYEDYNIHTEQTGVSGCMIARGALIKPWIFTEIKEQRHWDISSSERFDMLKKFVNYGLEHWGSDQQGVETVRRFLLEWLSFLYRYIPVGLLEQVPQKINERPPFYVGRNDLETLMKSSNCGDWIKITEMLLGPVPEGFVFFPKHKANAYK